MMHKLNVLSDVKLINQKKRIFNREKQEAMNNEVEKLGEVGFIREVMFPQWFANFVLVRKANRKYRV